MISLFSLLKLKKKGVMDVNDIRVMEGWSNI